MRVNDLDPDRTVYRKTGWTVVHLGSNCPKIPEGESPNAAPAGSLWDDTKVCKRCSGQRRRPPGAAPASISPETVEAMDPEDVGLSPMGERR